MGQEEAEQFLSSRLSHNALYKQGKNNVRYVSNVPESLKELKSLNTYKKKGRWKLMPKDLENTKNSKNLKNIALHEDHKEVDQNLQNFDPSEESDREEYYEYDDYEEEVNDYYEEMLDSEGENKDKNIREKSPPGSPADNRISLTNLNKFYKK